MKTFKVRTKYTYCEAVKWEPEMQLPAGFEEVQTQDGTWWLRTPSGCNLHSIAPGDFLVHGEYRAEEWSVHPAKWFHDRYEIL